MVSLRNNIPEGWEELWKRSDDELEELEEMLSEKVERDGCFYPALDDVFKIFHLVKPENVRLVIMGQDPYHQPLSGNLCRATGLSFSVRYEDEVPVSLKNIYKEIKSCYPEFVIPTHGNLEKWTNEGIFLLNGCLTVKPSQPGSHGEIWMGFIRKAIMYINEKSRGVIYFLWGKNAQQFAEFVSGGLAYEDFTNSALRDKYLASDKPVLLSTSHPSGFSANKGFFGSKHFKIANDILKLRGKEEIDWSLST